MAPRKWAPYVRCDPEQGDVFLDHASAVLTGSFAGRYTIERVLGRGATATVYDAVDAETQNRVAIKVLKPDFAESIGPHRFLREIRLTQQLKHPNIVPVLDSGEFEHKLFLVLPVFEETLRDRLNREPQLPIPDAVAIAQTLAGALGYAHKSGVVHRDVKPENILLSKDKVCLADFGIARAIERAIDESSTSTGIVRGTPAYMSPEQASGEHDYDGRSDIFSLACVVYEMLAGMRAFVGPTPKAIMAQRLVHPPRPVSVYRPNVPARLEDALTRALQVLPADRFATAGEFSAALEKSLKDPTPAAKKRRWRREIILAGVGAVAIALTSIVVTSWRPWKPGGPFGPKPDTTRIAIFPFEGDASAPRRDAYEMLHQALATWKGITIVDELSLRDARRSDAPVVNEDEARRAAKTAGAGRFVRSRLTRSGDSLRMWSGLFDSESGSRLYEWSSSLAPSIASSKSVIRSGADQLLLRSDDSTSGSRVLPAVQLLRSALTSIKAFNLRTADSLLMSSLEADPDYARSALWLAQVRNWRLDQSDSWITWAERANTGTGLTAHEKEFAQALVAMGKHDFPAACGRYEAMKARDDRDFATWYGLAQCRRQDDLVIPDRSSPSGWRFRSSSHESAEAFARAFELAPALHTNFEALAYSELRDLLYARRSVLRYGVSAGPPKTRFLAYATLRGDTIAHIPYPEDRVRGGVVDTDPAGRVAALSRQREVFRRLAQSWAAALPRSPATKEALAVSLEMAGDERAVDTLRAARSLTEDRALRLRLSAEEVFMRVSFARFDLKHAQIARALGDSLLSSVTHVSRDEAAMLAPVAVVLGKCSVAGTLAAKSVSEAQARYLEVPLPIVAAAESVTVVSAMGCRNTTDTSGIHAILEGSGGSRNRDSVEYDLLSRAITLTYPLDSERVTRLASVIEDYVLTIQAAGLRKDIQRIRLTMKDMQRIRQPADVTPDTAYPEALEWIAIGDRAAARDCLDPILARRGWLDLMLNDPVGSAALLRAVETRAMLALGSRDRRNMRKWGSLLSVVWNGADAELQPLSRRMSILAAN